MIKLLLQYSHSSFYFDQVFQLLIGITISLHHCIDLQCDHQVSVMNYFDDYKSSKPDSRREKITILDVLNMSSGIKWDESSMAYTDPSSDCVQMELSNDWIQYVIDREMAESPGTKFNYNSGETMLLSYLINKTTGTDLAKYLEKNLFSVIGIRKFLATP